MWIDGDKSLFLAIVMGLVPSLLAPWFVELLFIVASSERIVLRHEGAHHILDGVGFCCIK